MKTQITVWPDDTEGRQNRTWIVSRDTVEEIGGGSNSTETLASYRCEADAHTAARTLAEKEQLPLVTQDSHGASTCHMDMLRA